MSSHVFASVHDWTKYLRDSKGIKYTMVHAVAHAIAYSTYWWFDLEDELNVRPLVIFSGMFCPLSASPNTTRNRSCDQENQEGQKEQEPDIARQHTSTYWQKKHQETSRNIKKHQETSRNTSQRFSPMLQFVFGVAQDLNCLTHEATCLNGKPSPAISRQRLPKAMKAGVPILEMLGFWGLLWFVEEYYCFWFSLRWPSMLPAPMLFI